MDFFEFIGQFLNPAVINGAIRYAVPIILGALAGIVSERSGIVNIAIEGKMLAAAFSAFAINVFLSADTAPAFLHAEPVRLTLAVLGGAAIGSVMAMLHAVLTIRYKVDHIISGTVINIFAAGITSYLYLGGVNVDSRLPVVIVNPFTPEQGLLYQIGSVIFNKAIITYLAFILVFVVGYALYHTTWGLRTRAIGENPRAADTLGVNVHQLQYTNLAISGALAGLAGAFLVLEGVSFERGMTAGRGFIALAVMIFGMWRPSRAFIGAMIFGFANAIQSQIQLLGVLPIPHQFIAMIPYLLTLIVLAGFVGRARPPAHVGQSYDVE